MATREQKVKLGIFLLCTGVGLLALLGAFLGITLWRSVERYYVLVPDSVEGLERGAPVRVRGVRVGSVGDFELYPEGVPGVRVTLEIDSGVRVSSDAKAFLKFQGLTGIKQIDLLEGSPAAPPTRPESYIAYGETPLQKLSERADEVAERSLALLSRAESLVARLTEIAEGVDVERLQSSVERADRLLAALTTNSAEAGELLRAARREIERTSTRTGSVLGEVERFVANAGVMTTELGRSSRELEVLVRTTEAPLRSTVYNLREASQSFRELGRTLSQDPSALLFSDPPRERELP
jgi:ABC-type transporter Mla subunit MlaD